MSTSRAADPARQRLRVLWLIDSLTMGGAETLTATLAASVDRSRIELEVCCLTTLGGNPLEPEIHDLGVGFTNLEARHLRDIGGFVRLLRLLRSRGADLIHAHLTYASIWACLAGRILGIPVVATLHVMPTGQPAGSRDGIRERIMCGLLERCAERIIAVSAAQRDAYVSAGRLSGSRLTVVHNGIAFDEFEDEPGAAAADLRSEFGFPPDARVVIAVARLTDRLKGIDVLLSAAAHVAAVVPSVRFLIVGDGSLRPELQDQARELGVEGVVAWAGARRDVPRLLRGADLFVLPSLEDPLPTVLMEAMAAGLPTVSTRVDGIPEIVDEPRTGRLVKCGDAAALAQAMAELLDRPDELRRLGAAARQRARERFSTDSWAAALEDVYVSALQTGSRRARPPVRDPGGAGLDRAQLVPRLPFPPHSPWQEPDAPSTRRLP